jgi:hypothetical protein
MSVWSDSAPASPSLGGVEGELVSVSISIEPRLLEELLDVLASLAFPINPQIYHNAGAAWQNAGGLAYSDSAADAAAVVEFPAWAGRLGEVQEALARAGFPPAALTVRSMLETIGQR